MCIFSSFKFLDETVPFYLYLILQVVPFTPSAGILEWVDRTIPLGEYLLGRFELYSCCFNVKCVILLLQEIICFPVVQEMVERMDAMGLAIGHFFSAGNT